MLADDAHDGVRSGNLAPGLHRPASWLIALIEFIADQLPLWRDRPDRPSVQAETELTSQLCAHLSSAARKSHGWDVLQFRTEVPDEVKRARRLDLAPAPCGEVIWIEGRPYGDFDTLLPIECKRLPTPPGKTREKREYLWTSKGNTGGIQRFKDGHHGAAHSIGAMIAYVQTGGIPFWAKQIERWLRALTRAGVANWSMGDALRLHQHNPNLRLASLMSEHARGARLTPIALCHLWIEIP